MGELEEYIKGELTRKLAERFAELPWWCMLCGEGGNYEGLRPDEYWYPPEEHVCPEFTAKFDGITGDPVVYRIGTRHTFVDGDVKIIEEDDRIMADNMVIKRYLRLEDR